MKKTKLLSQGQIQEIINKLGNEINEYYQGSDLIVVTLLRGGAMFSCDLVKKLDGNIYLDYLTSSSYLDKKESTGKVNILSDIRVDIKDKDVLIVDDILDTGHTLSQIRDHLESKGPKSLEACVLLSKPARREVDIDARFIGKAIDDLFVVGYGLDYEGYYRNIPYIFTFDE